MDLQNKTLEDILCLLPIAVEWKGNQYDLNIHHGKRWVIQYIRTENESVVVDSDGIHFGKRFNLFFTFYSDQSIKIAALQCLHSLHKFADELMFIPRIHPFQIPY